MTGTWQKICERKKVEQKIYTRSKISKDQLQAKSSELDIEAKKLAKKTRKSTLRG